MKTYYNDILRDIYFENKTLNLEEVKAYFQELSAHRGSYIAFIDRYNEVIIFNWHKRNKWLVEHLVVPDELHRQQYATNEGCMPLIEKIYNGKDVGLMEGFEDVPVGEFTLDQILLFKQEDEKLLNEEETTVIKKSQTQQTSPVKKKEKSEAFQIMGERLNKKEQQPKPTPEKTTTQPTQNSMVMGENLNAKKPKPASKKTTPKSVKDKPKDDKSFFQI